MNFQKIWSGLGFSVMLITGLSVPNQAWGQQRPTQPIQPGSIIVLPTVCVNTTGGTCESGVIVIDDGTCKRNVVVQPSSLSATGNQRTDIRSTKIVEIGGCVSDGKTTGTVIVAPQILVTPKTVKPVEPVTPKFPNSMPNYQTNY
jgi:hypothetical protein